MRRGVRARALALALLLAACVGALAPAGAAAKALQPVPPCELFEGTVNGFGLGSLRGPAVTTFGKSVHGHGTTCTWTGQGFHTYSFVVSVAVFPASAKLGTRLLKAAEQAADAANKTPGGLGLVTSKNPRRGNYFIGEAVYREETPDTDTEECPPLEGLRGGELSPNREIEVGQSGPACAGEPGVEGDYLTAYGSPIGKPGTARGAIEPMILQVGIACQYDALRPGILSLSHLASAVYGGRGY
jgi:hypothetical protein